MIINNLEDLKTTKVTEERKAFLQGLLNDYTSFDDAEYPNNYNHRLTLEDESYIEPIIRKVWNDSSAASWGFNSREEIEEILNSNEYFALTPEPTAPAEEPTAPVEEPTEEPTLVRARNEDGTYIADDPETPDVDEAWVTP